LRNFDVEAAEVDSYLKGLKEKVVMARGLLDIDQVEARALRTRTGCSSIYDLGELMGKFIKDNKLDHFESLVESAVILKRKAVEFIKTLTAIVDFEKKVNYDYQPATNTQPATSPLPKTTPSSPRSQSSPFHSLLQPTPSPSLNPTPSPLHIDSTSLDLAISYLPYWDTPLTSRTQEAARIRDWFHLTHQQAYNLCRPLAAMSLREIIGYRRVNPVMYTDRQIGGLERRGVNRVEIMKWIKLVGFLDGVWKVMDEKIRRIMESGAEDRLFKLDLSGVRIGSTQTLSALFIAYFNCGHKLRRLDLR